MTINVLKATPVIIWSTPADITYGTALGAAQLNDTASVSGTFVYSPTAGTILNAGTNQTLHVDFTPTDTTNYIAASKDVTIRLTKAPRTVMETGGTFVYDWQPHAASGFAYGVGGTSDLLTPTLIFIYNGLGSVPVAAGTYNVVGRFAGNSNYVQATNTAVLTIAFKIYLPLVTRNGS